MTRAVKAASAAVKVERHARTAQGADDMHNLRRIGLTWYARFIVPKDRWADVGRVTGAKNGKRREVVRTLETRDLKEARKRRPAALEAIRSDLNGRLEAARLRPLDDGWAPSWQAEAMSASAELRSASTEARWYDPDTGTPGPSDRDLKELVMLERVEAIGDRHGHEAAKSYANIALGKILPIGPPLIDGCATLQAPSASRPPGSMNGPWPSSLNSWWPRTVATTALCWTPPAWRLSTSAWRVNS